MTILTNFTPYTPEAPEKLELQKVLGITFLRSKEGVDWYEAPPLFAEDTIKLLFDWDTGVIFYAHMDVTTFYPEYASIAEIPNEGQDLTTLKGMVFTPRTKQITERVLTTAELAEQAENRASILKAEANEAITPLQYAKELDMISEDEAAYLKELQRYVVLLHRVTSQEGYPRDIVWPEMPTK